MVDRPLLRECNGNSTAIQQRPPRHPDVDVITTLWNSDRAMEAGFTEPRREILDLPHFTRWLQSRAYVEYKGFIETLNDSVTGKKVSEVGPLSERVIRVVEMLNTVQGWIRELPPDTTRAQRFGNTRFRDWVKRLEEMSEMLLMDLLPERSHPAIVELKAYLEQSFGNSARIDYGSGHEMYFVVWLFCMSKIGYFAPSDGPAMVLVLFSKYLDVVRDLQRTYNLEPAGSHGVWGLDDYQFLPYYFGSAQFIGSSTVPAISIDPKTVDCEHREYLYLGGIKFIFEMKKGPFFEHSRQLYDISGVQTWEKVNKGLSKMYDVEVLSKSPVVQHLVFGSLFSFEPSL